MWVDFKSSLRHMADLSLALVYIVGSSLLVLSLPAGNTVRVIAALPMTLFVPGYGIVAALFPESDERATVRWESRGTAAVDMVERVALSFALSIAMLPLLGLALSVLGLPLGPATQVTALSVVSSTLLCIAAARRHRLPPHRQFRVPFDRWQRRLRARRMNGRSPISALLNLLLVVVVILSVSTLGYGLLATEPSESYTELTLLTENETGAYVADAYPVTTSEARSEPLYVRLENREERRVRYTIVAQLQRVDESDGGLRVRERREVRRFSPTVSAGDTWVGRHTLSTTMDGQSFRLVYLLYEGEPPSRPTIDSAYRYTFVWIEGSEDGATPTASRPNTTTTPTASDTEVGTSVTRSRRAPS